MEKVFCEYCCQHNEYTTREENLIGKVDGRYIFYKGKRAYCKKCGGVVYPQEVLDYNLSIVNKEAACLNKSLSGSIA